MKKQEIRQKHLKRDAEVIPMHLHANDVAKPGQRFISQLNLLAKSIELNLAEIEREFHDISLSEIRHDSRK